MLYRISYALQPSDNRDIDMDSNPRMSFFRLEHMSQDDEKLITETRYSFGPELLAPAPLPKLWLG